MFEFSDKEPIFRSESDEKQFQDKGYIRKNLLSSGEVDRLTHRFQKLHPDGVKGFYTTTYNQDPSHRALVEKAILEVALPRVEEIFHDFQVFFASFIVKEPGPESELNLHQDMTLVDESKYCGINIWCPLISLNEQNGAIEVLPGSHRIFPTYRGASIPSIYHSIVPEIRKFTQPMYLSAGEAIIFDQSIVHYSPANLSNRLRPVINIFVAHKDAGIIICHYDEQNAPDQIEFFAQDSNFLRNFQQFGEDIFSRPKIGESIGFKPYNFPLLTVEKLYEIYRRDENRNNDLNVLDRISNFVKRML